MSASILNQHIAACPICRRRIDREAGLESIRHRTLLAPDGAGPDVAYTSMPSPFGTMWIAVGSRGVIGADFAVDEARFCHRLETAGHGIPAFAPEACSEAANQFAEFFAGTRRTFQLPVDLRGVTPFQRSVLEAVGTIPYGEVRSYGEIASLVGRTGAARAVGTALASNPVSLLIPCHRVVRADGAPGEYALQTLGACGIHYKLALLELERNARCAEPAEVGCVVTGVE